MKTIPFLAFLITIGFLTGCGNEGVTSPASTIQESTEDVAVLEKTLATIPVTSLDQNTIDGLIYMREEEKLARDVYQHFFERYNARAFSNIASSEATHSLAIKVLLTRYAIADPVVNDARGIFSNQHLADLYVQLTALGDANLTAAYRVGAMIEDLDIKDLMDHSAGLTATDILRVYSNLTRGSRNHLRSYYSLLTAAGGTYSPTNISASLFTSIITSRHETGRPW